MAAVVNELKRLGIRAEEEKRRVRRSSGGTATGQVETYEDHRMAMSFAVTGLVTPGIRIMNPGCVSKTFPSFFQVLKRLTGG